MEHADSKNSNNNQASKRLSLYEDLLEEQAFAKDVFGPLGGCVWPPTSYSCSFCRREFRSAQALGGHMNVHRRDRAVLKHSQSLENITFYQEHQNLFVSLPSKYPSHVSSFNNSKPNSYTGYRNKCAKRRMSEEDIIVTQMLEPRNRAKDFMENDTSTSVDLFVCKATLATADVKEDAATGYKRRRTGELRVPLLSKATSVDKSEMLKLCSSSIDDLDLELRLGDPPKVK